MYRLSAVTSILSLLWIGLVQPLGSGYACPVTIVAVNDELAAGGDFEALPDKSPDDVMLAMLRKRLVGQPEHSDTWRLIGRLERKRGNLVEAIAATEQALKLDSLNAAAHFDFAEMMMQSGKSETADYHRQQVVKIAPDSSYASELIAQGMIPDPTARRLAAQELKNEWGSQYSVTQAGGLDAVTSGEVEQVGYEIQTFDGGDDLDREIKRLKSTVDFQEKPIRFFLESGAQYNSNVSLTPISRELVESNAASAQFFVAPELEWTVRREPTWRVGPLLRGYFSVNEQQWSAFNLASFQPGAFGEREFNWLNNDLIGRVDYVYALDIVGGERLGDRHAITTSLISIQPDLDVTYGYITTSFSQFDDDGLDSQINSLDGHSVTGGISHFFQTEAELVPNWSLGLDLENTDTEGANFRYRGITFHTSATIQFSDRLSFLPTAGVGGRTYPDFTGAVNRDEVTWRVGGRLRWQHSKRLSFSAVANHDRFASDNTAFNAQRTQVGLVTTFVY